MNGIKKVCKGWRLLKGGPRGRQNEVERMKVKGGEAAAEERGDRGDQIPKGDQISMRAEK